MKVRATFPQGSFGFYGDKRRYDGEEFEFDGEEPASWMEVIEEEKPKRGRPKKVKADDDDNDVSGTEG